MQEAPDISKIVSVIMQNPALISEIAALAGASSETATPKETEAVSEVKEESEPVALPTEKAPSPQKRVHRRELLNAMKPYLSEGRRGALDSMSSILDILEVMGRKEL